MSTINDGGPAFPSLRELGDIATTDDGMALRDYFAAKAMQGLIVVVEAPRTAYIAGTAYAMADAMLAARKPNPNQ